MYSNLLAEPTKSSPEYPSIAKQRQTELEGQALEIGSTTDAVGFIDYVQQVKRKVKGWESNTGEYREGQQVLERHRFQFPSNWLKSSLPPDLFFFSFSFSFSFSFAKLYFRRNHFTY